MGTIAPTAVKLEQLVSNPTCLNLVEHAHDVRIELIYVLHIQITIPHNTFKQHLQKTFFQLEGEMVIDETLVCEQVQILCIACWTITKEEQLTKINLGSKEIMQQVKININLEPIISSQLF